MAGFDNLMHDKSFTFAIRVVKAYQYLTREKKEYVLSKQLLRSGTAIGASLRESKFAQSRADFVSKLSISLKEANETSYWLELLFRCGYIDQSTYESIYKDCNELISLLAASVKSAKLPLN